MRSLIPMLILVALGCDDRANRPSPTQTPAATSAAVPTELKQSVAAIKAAVEDAQAKAEEAKVAAVARLRQSPEFVTLNEDIRANEARLNEARKSGTMEERFAAGSAFNKGREKATRMIADAIKSDAAVKQAREVLAAARRDYDAAASKLSDAERKMAEGERASDQLQSQRRKLIEDLMQQGIVRKVDGSSPHVKMWVNYGFYALNFDDKQQLASVVYAYYHAADPDTTAVDLRDAYTGKEVGSFSQITGELTMD